MKVSQLAFRYAKAVYQLSSESKNQDKTLGELRALAQAFGKDFEIGEFLASPLIKPEDRERALNTALQGGGVSTEVHQLLLLLIRNGRFKVFSEVVEAFQTLTDEANGVCRGAVRSAVSLGPNERQQIETIVEKVLKKKVIMTYKVDPAIIGGLVAQVGSYTFDDSLDAHLRRMNDELKRRAL